MSKLPGANCARCTLFDAPVVPSYGDPEARWVIVGEAPGAVEVEQGMPFVGKSGQLLAAAFELAGEDLNDSFRTNVVACRPPGNRTPTPNEIACCKPRLLAELRKAANPLLAMGLTACEALGVDFRQKGAWAEWESRPVKPAWHPAYVLREPGEAPTFLAEVASYLRGEEGRKFFDPKVIWVNTPGALNEMLRECPDNTWVSFDIETDQIRWYDTPEQKRDPVLMLQLAWSYDFGIVISDEMLYDVPETRVILNEFFSRVRTVGHNAKFDAVFLRSHFDINPHVDFDTLLAMYILDEGMPRGLKILVALEFGMPDYEEDLIKQYLTTRNDRYSKVDPEALAKYGVLDVVCTLALRELFEQRMIQSGQYKMPFQEIIMPASRVLENVELRGIQIDDRAMEEVSTLLLQKIDEKADSIREIAEDPTLNPNSTQQMAVVLYDKLRLPTPRNRRVKPRSTGAEALEILKGQHEVIGAIKEYRRVKKLYTSYVRNVAKFRDIDGRVHGNFLIYGTEVGRLAVRDPALQTIPRPDDEYGAMIRGMYCAKPGYVWVVADYSQAELRVAAVYTQEPFLLNAYRSQRDLHSEVALAMYGPDFTKAQRVICKMFNFSYVYGGSEYSFAESSGLPIEVARQFVRDYNKNMPIALQWKKDQLQKAMDDGYVETIFGRRRHFPLIVPENLDDVRKACVHMVIASTASDLTLMSVIEAEDAGLPVVLSVHDSVIVEVPEDVAEVAAMQLHKIMTSVGNKYLPDVPWNVDVEIRKFWHGGSYRELIDGEFVEHE
jgi:DNA polymerase-1